MIDEKLADRNTVGPSMQERILETLQEMEKHLKAIVYYSTPERAFLPSAGKATLPADTSDLQEMIKEEVGKYLKENE